MTRAEVRDKNRSIVKTYSLSNPVGQLSDATQGDGRIRYRAVGTDGRIGLLLIDRRQGATHILISFQFEGGPRKEHSYEISSVEVVE